MLTALPLFGACVLGLTALALAMDRHHDMLARPWRGRLVRLILRLGGIALLAGALVGATDRAGSSQGVILWLGALTPSALVVIGTLSLVRGPAKPKGAPPEGGDGRRVS